MPAWRGLCLGVCPTHGCSWSRTSRGSSTSSVAASRPMVSRGGRHVTASRGNGWRAQRGLRWSGLPGRAGLEVLASVRRAKPEVPVIVLTARGEIEDRIAGLDAGAVDYLVKPFSLAELLARVRAQLRVVAQTSATTLRSAGIEANLLTRKVRRGEAAVQLSSTEFELLVYLLRHYGQVLSREQILSEIGRATCRE